MPAVFLMNNIITVSQAIESSVSHCFLDQDFWRKYKCIYKIWRFCVACCVLHFSFCMVHKG